MSETAADPMPLRWLCTLLGLAMVLAVAVALSGLLRLVAWTR